MAQESSQGENGKNNASLESQLLLERTVFRTTLTSYLNEFQEVLHNTCQAYEVQIQKLKDQNVVRSSDSRLDERVSMIQEYLADPSDRLPGTLATKPDQMQMENTAADTKTHSLLAECTEVLDKTFREKMESVELLTNTRMSELPKTGSSAESTLGSGAVLRLAASSPSATAAQHKQPIPGSFPFTSSLVHGGGPLNATPDEKRGGALDGCSGRSNQERRLTMTGISNAGLSGLPSALPPTHPPSQLVAEVSKEMDELCTLCNHWENEYKNRRSENQEWNTEVVNKDEMCKKMHGIIIQAMPSLQRDIRFVKGYLERAMNAEQMPAGGSPSGMGLGSGMGGSPYPTLSPQEVTGKGPGPNTSMLQHTETTMPSSVRSVHQMEHIRRSFASSSSPPPTKDTGAGGCPGAGGERGAGANGYLSQTAAAIMLYWDNAQSADFYQRGYEPAAAYLNSNGVPLSQSSAYTYGATTHSRAAADYRSSQYRGNPEVKAMMNMCQTPNAHAMAAVNAQGAQQQHYAQLYQSQCLAANDPNGLAGSIKYDSSAHQMSQMHMHLNGIPPLNHTN